MRRRVIPLIFLIPAVYLLGPVFWAPIGHNLYNFFQAKRGGEPWNEVAVVQIKQSTLDNVFEKPLYPLSGHVQKHAKLINIIHGAQAKSIVFDLALSSNLISKPVEPLVKAIKSSGIVYLAMSTKEIISTTEKGESIIRHKHSMPHDSLRAASRGSFVIDVKIDSDGILRRYYPDGKIERLGLKRLPEVLADTKVERAFPIEFPSINQQIPMVEYGEVLNRSNQALSKLKNRIVFIGSVIQESNDFISISQPQLINGIESYQIPGVLALAAITENILKGMPLRDMKNYEQFLIILFWCLIVVSFMPVKRPVCSVTFIVAVITLSLLSAAFLHIKMGIVSEYGLLFGAVFLCGVYSWIRLEIHTVKELYREEAENQRVKTEMENARKTQLAFLPSEIPDIPGLDIWGLNLSSKVVSGDYYDIIEREMDNSVVIALGDVSGKGMPASLLMSNAQACLHSHLFQKNFEILRTVNVLNRLIYENTDVSKFITFFLGQIKLNSKNLQYVRAGHELPFVVSPDGSYIKPEEGGLALGVLEEAEYEVLEIALNPGDVFCTYTDGITEARNSEGEEFGEGRLVNTVIDLRDSSSRAITEQIVTRIQSFTGKERQADDITLVVIKVKD